MISDRTAASIIESLEMSKATAIGRREGHLVDTLRVVGGCGCVCERERLTLGVVQFGIKIFECRVFLIL